MPRVAIDFEAEGLLEGVEGEAREARRELLEELASRGVPLSELKEAVAEGRLVLLPVERVLSGDGSRYSREEVSELAGVEAELLAKQWRALGMPEPEDGAKVFSERDVDAAKRVKGLREQLKIPDDEMLQISRVIGMNMSQLAAASRGLGIRVFTGGGDTELEVAHRFATIVEGLGPLLTPTLEYVLQLHMREQIRHDAFGDREILEGVESAREIAVAFADLVGFTKLGERLDPAELSDLTDRLGELAGDVATGPVRLVKLIGDAAMLTAREPEPLLDAALALVAASEQEGEGFPLLRAGVAAASDRSRRRLLRSAGEPCEPRHQRRVAGKRALRRAHARRRRRLRIQVVVRGGTAPEGHQRRREAVSCPCCRSHRRNGLIAGDTYLVGSG